MKHKIKHPMGGRVAPRTPGGGGMMQQFQKLQEDMAKTQEALTQETLEITAGGGAVTIVITGDQHVKSLRLKPEVVDPADVDMLQDLLVAAINQAIEASKNRAGEAMQSLTGGLNIPGLT